MQNVSAHSVAQIIEQIVKLFKKILRLLSGEGEEYQYKSIENFATQLFIDLVFSFFTRFFNIEKTVKYIQFNYTGE